MPESMSRARQVGVLLLRMDELRQQGREVVPEELCRDCPELLPYVQPFLQSVRALDGIPGDGSQAATLPPPGPAPSQAECVTLPPPPSVQAQAETLPPVERGASVAGYEVLGELARGGMGVVYQARDPGLQRLVALKMVLAGGHAGETDLARFRTEAEAVARLQHPNIVQIYQIGEHEGLPYFALEFCSGGSLDRKLNGTPLPPKESAQLLETLARAIHAAHQAGVVHRDLKPANVLLAADGTPKITDFGLAKKLDQTGQTQTGAIVGTPSYMAPEQAAGKGKQVGPAADIYALGATLYECLTGRPPFKAATPLDTIHQVISEEPIAPRRLVPKVPRDLETICLKCLHKQPARRYATAEALAEDLRRFQKGEPIRARRVGRIERMLKWNRNHRAASSLIGLTILVVVAGFANLVWYTTRAIKAGEANRQMAKLREDEDREQAKFQALRAEHARHALHLGYTLRAWENRDLDDAWRNLDEAGAPPPTDFLTAGMFKGLNRNPQEVDLTQTWEHRHVRGLLSRKAHRQEMLCLKEHPGSVPGPAFLIPQIASAQAMAPLGSPLAGLTQVLTAVAAASMESVTLWSVRSVAFSPDGKRIAAAGGWVKVWEVATGKEVLSLRGRFNRLAFSPDGGRIATAGEDGIMVWDAATGQEILSLKGSGGATSLAFSPDGQRIVSGGHSHAKITGDLPAMIKVWDAATGLEVSGTRVHPDIVTGVAFSQDGRRLISGARHLGQESGDLKIWDMASGQEKSLPGSARHAVWTVAFSPDGQRIVSGHYRTVKVWDAATGQQLASLSGHKGIVYSVAFSPDGTRIVSGAGDLSDRGDFPGEIKVWDVATGLEKLALRGHTGPVYSVSFSPDGQRIVSGGRAAARLGSWLRVEVDGRRHTNFLEAPGEVKVWEAGTGRQ